MARLSEGGKEASRGEKVPRHSLPERSRSTRDSWCCRHPSRCNERRSVKRNGELHWLCERHRRLQNAEQRERYKQRKREKANARISTSSESATTTVSVAGAESEVDTVSSKSYGKCEYSVHCDRARAVKRNGELHRLCVIHQRRTNEMQRTRYRDLRLQQLTRRLEGHEVLDEHGARANTGGGSKNVHMSCQSSQTPRNGAPTGNDLRASRVDSATSQDAAFESVAGPLLEILMVHREEVTRRMEADRLLLERCDAFCRLHLEKYTKKNEQ